MKNIFRLYMVLFLVIFISACGGSTGHVSSGGQGSSLTVQTKKSSINEGKNEMKIDFSIKNNYSKDIEVELSDLGISVSPCKVKNVVFSPTKIRFDENVSEQSVHAVVSFKEACTPTSYLLKGNSLLNQNGRRNDIPFNSSVDEITLDAEETVVAGVTHLNDAYRFVNVPDGIEVIKDGQKVFFEVQLIDENKEAVGGKTISALSYDTSYGHLESMSVTTDKNGFAKFELIAPDSIENISGKDLKLDLVYRDEGAFIKTVVTISFNKVEDKKTIEYSFANVSKGVEVIKDGQKVFFEVQLIDENKEAVAGKTISVLSYDTSYGHLESVSVITDKNGFAKFGLTAPDSIDNINGRSLKLDFVYRDGGAFIETAVTISFKKIKDKKRIKYSFTNVSKGIKVIKDGQKVFFEVQLIDENQEAVGGKTISALSYDTSYGHLESMSVTTDKNGFAKFGLIAPDSIDNISGNLKLELIYREGDSFISTVVTILFKKENVSGLYQFKNIPSLLVTHNSKSEDISISLVDSNGVGVSGKELEITTLDRKYGSMSSSKSTTDKAGVATFTYTSPEDIEKIDNQKTSVTVRFKENNFLITTKIEITFKYSNNNIEESVLPTVVIPNGSETIELTTNSTSIEIPIQVFKNIAPYDKGKVKVELPSKVLNGVDVGLFESYEVEVNSQGIATFNYTGPANLKALMDGGDLESIFKFYHSENTAIENRQAIKVLYDLDEDTYTPIDYILNVTTTSNDFSMGIPDKQKTFSIILKDTNGKVVDNSDINITKIEVSSENILIAKIFDTQTGRPVNRLTLKNENNSAFTLNSEKLSGIAPLKVTVEFKDINNEFKELSTIVNIRVMSGPPSAISVSYVSTSQDKERAKYEEKFAISVTDEYGNKVNTQPYISVGAIVGYAVDGQSSSSVESSKTKRLYYGRRAIENSIANGVIDTLGDDLANTTNFEDNTANRSDVFKWVNAEGNNTDKLVVFGKGKNYEAMGKWDFSKINNNTLSLEDDYFGIYRDKLSYAIGHNYYQDQCLDDSREWLGSTDSDTYKLDDEGTVIVSYKYDYHLTGKEALVWVNLNGYQADTGKNTRIGEATKHTLRGKGLVSRPSGGYFVDKNSTAFVTFDIHHENAPEWYRNGHFGYEVVANKCAYFSEIDSINRHDARSCNNGGVAYVTFQVEAPEDSSCNFNIKDILVSDEF